MDTIERIDCLTRGIRMLISPNPLELSAEKVLESARADLIRLEAERKELREAILGCKAHLHTFKEEFKQLKALAKVTT